MLFLNLGSKLSWLWTWTPPVSAFRVAGIIGLNHQVLLQSKSYGRDVIHPRCQVQTSQPVHQAIPTLTPAWNQGYKTSYFILPWPWAHLLSFPVCDLSPNCQSRPNLSHLAFFAPGLSHGNPTSCPFPQKANARIISPWAARVWPVPDCVKELFSTSATCQALASDFRVTGITGHVPPGCLVCHVTETTLD